MKTSQKILSQSLHDAFVNVLMKVRSLDMRLSDMYVCVKDGEEASFVVYDDADNELYSTLLTAWSEWRADVDAANVESELTALLKAVVEEESIFTLFNEMEYNGPFSLLLVDEEMNIQAELLTIDHENIMIGDEFWEKMDRELDEFYEKLMSDIRFK